MVDQEISIYAHDFCIADEYEKLTKLSKDSGATVFFVGKVRQDLLDAEPVIALELEHYPGMTQKVLCGIVEDAKERFTIQHVRIIHRIGKLLAGSQIVFVGVVAMHRSDAFKCAEFLMDFLKTKAPFWKKEVTLTGSSWVKSKKVDETAASRW